MDHTPSISFASDLDFLARRATCVAILGGHRAVEHDNFQ